MSAGTDEALPRLRHVIVVGGSVAEWGALSAEQWTARIGDLGKVAEHVGARWLTMHPIAPSPGIEVAPRSATVGSCLVTAVPDADGRDRLVRAAESLVAAGAPISESSVAAALNSPAECDPDLVVVLGPMHRLPSSLVWELAYSELVFIDTTWAELSPAHLDGALESYTHRHRRFGGID